MLDTTEKHPKSPKSVKDTSAPEVDARNIDADVVEITPTMASEWLGKNTDNRAVSHDTVKRYSADMTADGWRFTGDPIRFDDDGVLIDGQHRLMACVDSGKPFWSLVIRGLPNRTKEVLDIGRKRNLSAILTSLGWKFSPGLSQAALALLSLKVGGLSTRQRISAATVIDVVRRHPKLEESVSFVKGDKDSKFPPGFGSMLGPMAAVHYVASEILGKKEAADSFIEVFKTGIPTYSGDVAHVLREAIMRERAQNRVLVESMRLGSLCQAWNYFEKQIPLKKFRRVKEAIIDGLDVDKI